MHESVMEDSVMRCIETSEKLTKVLCGISHATAFLVTCSWAGRCMGTKGL